METSTTEDLDALVDTGIAEGSVDAGGLLSATRVFWWSAALLALLLCTLLPLIHTEGHIAFPDEGVYSAQAKNLAEGSWASPRPAPELDPRATLDPIGPSYTVGDHSIPYANHPLYPLSLTIPYRLAGSVGLLAVSVVGSWVAAVTAGLVGRRLDPRYGVPTMWLTGVGTPLLFSAYLVMAHSLAAAMAGLLVWSVCRVVDDRRWVFLTLVAVSAVALTGVRSEGLVVAAAMGGLIGLQSLRPLRRERRIDVHHAVTGALILVVAAGSHVLESRLVRSITEAVGDPRRAADLVLADRTDPLPALGISLLQPWHDGLDALPPAALVLLGVVLAAVALRAAPSRPLFSLLALAGAAASAIWLQFAAPNLIAGLLPALPVAVFAWIFLRRSDMASPLIVRLVGMQAVSLVLLALTIYGDGGATQWGGRFFHVLIPTVTPLVVLGVHRAVGRLDRVQAVVALSCLTLITLSLSVISLRINNSMRVTQREIVNETLAAHRTIDRDGHRHLTVMAQLQVDGTSRAFWDAPEDLALLRTNDIRQLFPLMVAVSEEGYDRALVLTTRNGTTLEIFGEERLQAIEWKLLEERLIGSTGHYLLTYGPAD